MWYCPTLYSQAISATFTDEDIFQVSSEPPLTHHFDTFTTITTMLPDYHWAFNEWGPIPQAYILHKSEKHYGKGQPIVEESTGTKLSIRLKHIPLLVTAVLVLNYFTVGSTLIQQFRGAPMGSPCSPARCNLAVAVDEQCWHHTYSHLPLRCQRLDLGQASFGVQIRCSHSFVSLRQQQ